MITGNIFPKAAFEAEIDCSERERICSQALKRVIRKLVSLL